MILDVERPYHARLLLASASLFPPTPTDPAAELLPADALAQAYEAREATCPACKAHVPLANVRYACCEKGHQWGALLPLFLSSLLSRPLLAPRPVDIGVTHVRPTRPAERCSLSLALIASVQVRTCSSCERKALLPDALRDLPADGPVRRMLQAAKACVMCGGRWVRVR